MRNEFDFAPLYRSSIGFDRVFNLLNNAQRLHGLNHQVHDLLDIDLIRRWQRRHGTYLPMPRAPHAWQRAEQPGNGQRGHLR